MTDILQLLKEARRHMGTQDYRRLVDEAADVFDTEGSDDDNIVKFFSLRRRIRHLTQENRREVAKLPTNFAAAASTWVAEDFARMQVIVEGIQAILQELIATKHQFVEIVQVLFGDDQLDDLENCEML